MFSPNFHFIIIASALLAQCCFAQESFSTLKTSSGRSAHLEAESQSIQSPDVDISSASFSKSGSSFSQSETEISQGASSFISTGDSLSIQDSDYYSSNSAISESNTNIVASEGEFSQTESSFSTSSSTVADVDSSIVASEDGVVQSSSKSFSSSKKSSSSMHSIMGQFSGSDESVVFTGLSSEDSPFSPKSPSMTKSSDLLSRTRSLNSLPAYPESIVKPKPFPSSQFPSRMPNSLSSLPKGPFGKPKDLRGYLPAGSFNSLKPGSQINKPLGPNGSGLSPDSILDNGSNSRDVLSPLDSLKSSPLEKTPSLDQLSNDLGPNSPFDVPSSVDSLSSDSPFENDIPNQPLDSLINKSPLSNNVLKESSSLSDSVVNDSVLEDTIPSYPDLDSLNQSPFGDVPNLTDTENVSSASISQSENTGPLHSMDQHPTPYDSLSNLPSNSPFNEYPSHSPLDFEQLPLDQYPSTSPLDHDQSPLSPSEPFDLSDSSGIDDIPIEFIPESSNQFPGAHDSLNEFPSSSLSSPFSLGVQQSESTGPFESMDQYPTPYDSLSNLPSNSPFDEYPSHSPLDSEQLPLDQYPSTSPLNHDQSPLSPSQPFDLSNSSGIDDIPIEFIPESSNQFPGAHDSLNEFPSSSLSSPFPLGVQQSESTGPFESMDQYPTPYDSLSNLPSNSPFDEYPSTSSLNYDQSPLSPFQPFDLSDTEFIPESSNQFLESLNDFPSSSSSSPFSPGLQTPDLLKNSPLSEDSSPYSSPLDLNSPAESYSSSEGSLSSTLNESDSPFTTFHPYDSLTLQSPDIPQNNIDDLLSPGYENFPADSTLGSLDTNQDGFISPEEILKSNSPQTLPSSPSFLDNNYEQPKLNLPFVPPKPRYEIVPDSLLNKDHLKTNLFLPSDSFPAHYPPGGKPFYNSPFSHFDSRKPFYPKPFSPYPESNLPSLLNYPGSNSAFPRYPLSPSRLDSGNSPLLTNPFLKGLSDLNKPKSHPYGPSSSPFADVPYGGQPKPKFLFMDSPTGQSPHSPGDFLQPGQPPYYPGDLLQPSPFSSSPFRPSSLKPTISSATFKPDLYQHSPFLPGSLPLSTLGSPSRSPNLDYLLNQPSINSPLYPSRISPSNVPSKPSNLKLPNPLKNSYPNSHSPFDSSSLGSQLPKPNNLILPNPLRNSYPDSHFPGSHSPLDNFIPSSQSALDSSFPGSQLPKPSNDIPNLLKNSYPNSNFPGAPSPLDSSFPGSQLPGENRRPRYTPKNWSNISPKNMLPSTLQDIPQSQLPLDSSNPNSLSPQYPSDFPSQSPFDSSLPHYPSPLDYSSTPNTLLLPSSPSSDIPIANSLIQPSSSPLDSPFDIPNSSSFSPSQIDDTSDQVFDILKQKYQSATTEYLASNLVYPQDISTILDSASEEDLTFHIIIIGSSPAALTALKTLSDLGKQILLIERGQLPPHISKSLYYRPRILQSDYVRQIKSSAPYTDAPKIIFAPNVLGEESTYDSNVWDDGVKSKYVKWGRLCKKWSWNKVVHYFTGNEQLTCPIIPTTRDVEETKATSIVTNIFSDAGIYRTEYTIGKRPEGLTIVPFLQENGENIILSQKIFEELTDRTNINLALETKVESILFDNYGKAIGVNVKTPLGAIRTISILDELILGSNPVDTVQLLYQSGIGEYEKLQQLNIPVQINLPYVGKEFLVTPLYFGMYFKFPQGTLLNDWESDLVGMDYLFSKYQLPSALALDYYKVALNVYESHEANVILHFRVFSKSMSQRLRSYIERFKYVDENIEDYLLNLCQNYDLLLVIPQLTNVLSRGEINIDNSSGDYEPIIDTGIYRSKRDIAIMQKTLKSLKAISETETFKSLNGEVVQIPIQHCGESDFSTEYNRCSIRSLSLPNLHYSGGTIMGVDPLTSVVNEDLVVHGTTNMRIFSTSVIPYGTSTDSSAVSSMIGNYGAHIAAQSYQV